ncbi:MAG: hypothetical protein M9894_33495 [Planctomycetes bacterium]|nr:hypothetical protein [Planctomycetota bacterium]
MMERVGPYAVLEQLGRGGMGAVFRAQDTRTGEEVALKLLAVEEERVRLSLRVDRGNALLMLGRAREAIADYDVVLAQPTGGAWPHQAAYGRGVAREALGDLDGARADYRRALDGWPDNPQRPQIEARLARLAVGAR